MRPAAEERFIQIYEVQYPAVLSYCTRRVGRSEAEAVANEVFLTLWRRIDTIDVEQSPLPWLYGVARGVIRNRRKSAGRAHRLRARLAGLAGETSEPTDAVVVRHEEDRAVMAALDGLRPSDREVLLLSVWEGLSGPEIASVVGCSPSAAEQRLHRAKKRLARLVASQTPRTNTSLLPPAADQKGTP